MDEPNGGIKDGIHHLVKYAHPLSFLWLLHIFRPIGFAIFLVQYKKIKEFFTFSLANSFLNKNTNIGGQSKRT